jgi:hypothetical protein
LDVLNRKLAQDTFDDLAHLAKGMVTVDGIPVPPLFAVNTASPRFLAGLDHVEYGNVSGGTGECISALNPVVGQQHPNCGKSLEDLGQWGNPWNSAKPLAVNEPSPAYSAKCCTARRP